jgi:type II secretion system protein G
LKRINPAVAMTAALGVLAGCSGEAEREEAVRKAVEAAQFEQREIAFHDLRYYPGDVACGEYGSVDKWGRETSSDDFIVRAGVADIRPSREDRQVFCADDPAAEFRALTGIDWRSDTASQVFRDLTSLQQALRDYAADNGRVPTPRQGLAALAAASDTPPRPMKFREGGYIGSVPADPWGRDYLYQPGIFGGVANNPEIRTLGADGEEGGSGEDADISNRHLKYLGHLAGL